MPGTPTTKYQLPTMVGADLARDIDTAVTSLATTVDSKMVGYSSGTFALRPVSTPGSPGVAGRRYRATDTGQEFIDTGTGWVGLLQVVELGQSLAIAGEIRVPSGQVDVIPQFFVPVLTGQTVKLKRVRYSIAAGTSCTFKIQRNGADATGFTGMAATTTPAETDPADITLANNDRLQVVVTAVSGTPQNLSVTLVLEHSGGA